MKWRWYKWGERVGDGVGFGDGEVAKQWIGEMKAERRIWVVGKGEGARRLNTAANKSAGGELEQNQEKLKAQNHQVPGLKIGQEQEKDGLGGQKFVPCPEGPKRRGPHQDRLF